MNIAKLSKLHYEEVSKCTRCGFCLPECPTYTVKRMETYTARGSNAITRAVLENRLELSEDLAKALFHLPGLRGLHRGLLPLGQDQGGGLGRSRAAGQPEAASQAIMDKLSETLNEYHNITEDDQEDRAEWSDLCKELPEEVLDKEKAEIIYFVGCVASFFPMAQKIPAHLADIMHRAGLDFTVLGGEEWCCGFPLLGAGKPEEVEEIKAHNLEKVANTGAKEVVFACPSCFHTWQHTYGANVEQLHASQLLHRMVTGGQLKFKETKLKVTYHDPCDLGRNSGVYDEPREVINAIPGVELVELPTNKGLSICCGGGGNVEMVDPDLSAAIAQNKLDAIKSTGADAVVSSCQQCLRTIQTRATRSGEKDLKVMDLTELVHMALAD
jgi:heterodisulfide reductase subunit D